MIAGRGRGQENWEGNRGGVTMLLGLDLGVSKLTGISIGVPMWPPRQWQPVSGEGETVDLCD